MATDTTNVQSETANAGTLHESDVDHAQLTQSSGTPLKVQVPQGENVVRIQVTPGETVELPFPTDGMVAKLSPDNNNLAIKVGDITVILLGYSEATSQGEVTIVGNDAKPVDVAAVLASTDQSLDIQTAAGPGAGDQGTGADNNGALFAPFDPNAGIGGLNAIGGLQQTALNYVEIQREFPELIEADEEDTSPFLINITRPAAVNEDDLGGESRLQKLADPYPSHILSGLEAVPGIGGGASWGYPHGQGNDPFDTDDHEDGSQNPGASDNNNGVDQDREPTTTTAVVSVNFFADAPGHLSFTNGGSTPIITQLEAMNLTSHSNELHYVVLAAAADSDPDPTVDNSHGQTLVAYYVETVKVWVGGDGEEGGHYEFTEHATVVFTIAMREFSSNSDFDVDFTIYGVIDNVPGTADAAGDISDILDIGVPFFLVDSDGSVIAVPGDKLVFQDVDDTPSLGAAGCYQWVSTGEGEEGGSVWVPTKLTPSDTSIVHDETKGEQSGGAQWNDPDSDKEAQPEDDVNPNNYLGLKAASLSGAGLPSDTAILGMALSKLTVSFGADGPAGLWEQTEGGWVYAGGNKEAGKTVFTGDGDTYATAFQLYIGDDDAPLAGGKTNWTITENGVVIDVLAEQTDANTIVGYALVGEGEGQHRVEVFVLHVDPENGDLALVQIHQINQPDPTNSDDSTLDLTIGGQEVNFRGTDYDGDHVDAPLQVIVQDDGPTICKIEYCSQGTFKHDKGYVDEDFLTAPGNSVPGNQDHDTSPDNQNAPFGTGNNGDGKGGTHVTGQIIADFGTDGPGGFSFNLSGDLATLTVGGAGQDSGYKTAGGHDVFYKLVSVAGGVELQAYDKTDSSAVFTVFLNKDTGAFEFNLQQALFHKDNDGTATNDADIADDGTNRYEDDILLQFGVKVTDSDGDIKPATLQFLVDDDAPKLICPPHTTSIENGECPVCQTEVSLAVAEQDEECLSEETCMVTIAPGQQTPGWLHLEISVKDENGNTQGDDTLFQQNGLGYGVVSGEDGGSGGRFDEINYDHTANDGAGGSEQLIFKIGTEACPQVALSATVELSRFYSNEGNVGNERGHWEAWKDGVKVAEGDFTANNLNGQFGLAIPTVSGGFDELRFSALPGSALPGGGFGDDSDYYVQNLNLEIKPTHLINGEFKYTFGADDGPLAPGGVDIDFTGGSLTQGGKPVVLIETFDPETGKTTISAYVDGIDDGTEVDANDLPVFTLVLDPNASVDANGVHTASYTFTQFGPLDNDGGMSNLPFEIKIQDRDHDAIKTTIDICVDDSAPETSNACATVFEKGLDQDGSAKDGTDASANSELAHGFLNFSYNGDGPGSITSFALTSGPVAGVSATLANGVWTIDVPQFKITVDAITGEYNFTLKQNFTHDDTDDDGFNSREGLEPTANIGDLLKELGFTYTVKDGDGTAADGSLTVKVVDDGPVVVISNNHADVLTLDETRPTGTDTNNANSPSGRATTSANFADNFNSGNGFAYGADGPGGVSYTLVLKQEGIGSGLFALDPNDKVNGVDGIGQGSEILLTTDNNGDIVGKVGNTEYFRIHVDANNGTVTFSQSNNIWHENTNNHDDTQTLTLSSADLLQIKQTLVDADGDHDSDAINLGTGVFKIQDDGPTAVVKHNSQPDVLKLDESPVSPNGDGIHSVTANFADNFNSNAGFDFGSDGPGSVSYALLLSNNGIGSGLYALDPSDTVDGQDGIGQGNEIQLFKTNAGVIEGRVGNTVYFTISVDGDGKVTFTQLNNIWHDNVNNHDDSETLNLSNGKWLKIEQTLTDADGDTSKATIDLSDDVFKIEDDGPHAVVKRDSVADVLVLDETRPLGGDSAGGSAPNGVGSVSADFADNFNKAAGFDYGTDGPGHASYELFLSSNNIGSGLYALDPNDTSDGQDGIGQGSEITLSKANNGDIVGKVGNTEYFRISVDADGVVTFSQSNNIWHPNTNNHDDSQTLTLDQGKYLKLVQTLTDADGDTDTAEIQLGSGVFKIQDDGPDAIVKPGSVADTLTLDESRPLGSDTDGVAPNGVASVTADFSDNFNKTNNTFDYGSDGPGSVSYALSVSANGIASGLFALDPSDTNPAGGLGKGAQIVLNKDNNGNILGQVGNVTYFTISVDGNGVVTFSQQKNIWHSDTGNDDDTATLTTLTADKLKLTQTLVDADGDKDSASIDLGAGIFKIQDDGPDAVVKPGSVADTLTLDESRPLGSDTDGVAPNGVASVTADFSDNFNKNNNTFDYGSDGKGSVAYDLSVSSNGIGSGLFALDPTDVNPAGGLGKGAEIVLNKVGNDILGQVGNVTYFTISVDSNGTVTFSQQKNIWHSDTGNDDDTATLTTLTANALKLTQTLTDADGDQDSASIDLGANVFKIQDDGPDAVVKHNSVADTLTVDETRPLGTDTDGSLPNGVATATAEFSDNFNKNNNTFDYGSDGPGSVAYALLLSANGSASGLFALDPTDTNPAGGLGKGAEIVLNKVGNVVYGQVGSETYFTISVDGDGKVTFTQLKNIWHSDTGNDDDTATLTAAANTLKIEQTLTDADGDSDMASIDLSTGVFKIQDDGPDAVVNGELPVDTLTLDESPLPQNGDGIQSITANFGDNFNSGALDYGSDGKGSVAYSLLLAANGTASGLFALDPTDTNPAGGLGKGAEIVLNKVGDTVYGQVGNVTYFTISVDGSGVVTFSQQKNIWHSNTSSDDDTSTLNAATNALKIQQTLTDADGDKDSASIDLSKGVFKIQDDGPQAIVTNSVADKLALDESLLPQSGDGVHSATASFADNFNGGALDYGTDGPGSATYRLDVSGNGVATGLFALDPTDTLVSDGDGYGKGAPIVLNKVDDHTVVGQVGNVTYFTITVDDAGTVTFTQQKNIWHTEAGNPDETAFLNTPALNDLKITQTLTDADGDTSSASIGLGKDVFSIADDGPTLVINTGPSVAALSVVEDSENPGSQSLGIVGPNVTVTATDGYTTKTDYSLSLASALSGLKTSIGDHPITLVQVSATVIEGRFDNDGNPNNPDAVAFRVEIDGNNVKLSSFEALEHDNNQGPSPAEINTLNLDGKINLVATVTVTDTDGDQVVGNKSSASPLSLTFTDTDPTLKILAAPTIDALTVIEDSEIGGSKSATIAPPVYQASAVDGIDHVTIAYALTLVGTATNLVTTDGNHPITLVKVSDTLIEGRYENGGTQVAFTVTITGAPGSEQITLTSLVALEHSNTPQGAGEDNTLDINGLIKVSATVTAFDGDNDAITAPATVSSGLQLNFEDTDPTLVINTAPGVEALTVIEDSGDGGSQTHAIVAPTFVAAAVDGYVATTAYGLSILNDVTGLQTTNGNYNIILVKVSDSLIEGRYDTGGSPDLDGLAFTVKISGLPGSEQITLTSFEPLEHANGPQNTEVNTLDLNGKISLVATVTVTDGDNDQIIDSKSSSSALSLTFGDTDPTLTDLTAPSVAAVSVTEAGGAINEAYQDIVAPTFNATAVDGFTSQTDFKLALLDAASGLKTTDGEHPITLQLSPDGKSVVGVYDSDGNSSLDATAFRVEVVNIGGVMKVGLISYVALEHDNNQGGGEVNTLNLNGKINLVATVTVTDGDNDQVVSSSNSASPLSLNFGDTDPVIKDVVAPRLGALTVVEDSEGAGSSAYILAPSFSASAVDGIDHATVTYALGLPAGTVTTLQTTVGNFAITLVQVSPTEIQGQYQDGGTKVAFSVAISGSAGSEKVTLISYVALEHSNAPQGAGENNDLNLNGLVNIVSTITAVDKDGDAVSAPTSVSSPLLLTITDTDPNAVDDGTLTMTTLGSVTNPTTLLLNDLPAAVDGASITSVKFGLTDYALVGGTVDILVTGGTLTVKSDGTWSFNQTSYVGSPTTHNFTYTLTDGDGDTDTADFHVALKVSNNPTFSVDIAKLDEDGLVSQLGAVNGPGDENQNVGDSGAGIVDPDGAGPKSTESIWQQQINVDWGGPASGTFALSGGAVLDTNSNPVLSLDGQPLVWIGSNGGHTLTAYKTSDVSGGVPVGGAVPFITMVVTDTGLLTVNLLQPVKLPGHDDPATSSQVETAFEDNIQFKVTLTATNSNAQSTAHDVTVDIDDDSPTAYPNGVEATVTVDETNLNVSGVGNFSTSFVSANFGADGVGSLWNYTLGVKAGASIDSGLIDTATGNHVFLFKTGSQIVAKEGVDAATALASGNTVFTVTINDSNGDVTLIQSRAVVHANPADPDESRSLVADDLITVTVTIVDGDGDAASASVNIGQNLIFKDDGPTAVSEGVIAIFDDNASGVTVSNIASLMANGDSYGSDGPAAANAFTVGVGSLGGTIVVAPNGDLLYTSHHNTVPGETDVEIFTYTLTDKDGDTKSATFTINLTDTKPTLGTPVDSVVDEDGLPQGNPGDSYTAPDNFDVPGSATTAVNKALNINFGVDTPGTLEFNPVQAGLTGLTTASGAPVNIGIMATGQLVGYTGATLPTDLGNPAIVFYAQLHASGSGTYDFALLQPIHHPTANQEDSLDLVIAFVAKDAEGDATPGTFKVTVNDDAPVAIDDSFGTFVHQLAAQSIGNVLTNGTPDKFGADGAGTPQITGISASGWTAGGDAANGYTLTSAAGVIKVTVNGDVTFSGTASASVLNGVNFEYTIKDKDGDTDSATATFSISADPAEGTTAASVAVAEDSKPLQYDTNTGNDTPAGTAVSLTFTPVGDTVPNSVQLNDVPSGVILTYQLGGVGAIQTFTGNGTADLSISWAEAQTLKLQQPQNDSGQDYAIGYTVHATDTSSGETANITGSLAVEVNAVGDYPSALAASFGAAGTPGGTLNLTVNGSFGDVTDGSEDHYLLVKLPSNAWDGAADGFTVQTLAAGNTYGVPAGQYIVVNVNSQLGAGDFDATALVSIKVPAGTSGSQSFPVYAVAIDHEPAGDVAGVSEVTADDRSVRESNANLSIIGTPDLTINTTSVEVKEENLSDGTAPSAAALIKTGTFTIDPHTLTIDDVKIGVTGQPGTAIDFIDNGAIKAGAKLDGGYWELTITNVGAPDANGKVTLTYQVVLKDNTLNHDTDHDTVNDPGEIGKNNLAISLDVTATTAGGNSATGNVTINVVDDIPVAKDNALAVNAGSAGTADVVFIIDVSGSMTDGQSGVAGVPAPYPANRLGMARYSMFSLLNDHPEILNVKITKFDDDAQTTVWMSRADALAYIGVAANFNGGGTTNYDAALQLTMDTYTSSVRPAGQSDQTLVYFMSDGVPNPTAAGIDNDGSGVNVSIAEWEAFLNGTTNTAGQNITNVFGIGLGSGVQTGNLDPISYPNTNSDNTGAEDRVVVLATGDLGTLNTTLSNLLVSVVNSANGNLITDAPVDAPGADGWGNAKLVSVAYDTDGSGPGSALTTLTFTSSIHQFVINLGTGRGTLTVNDDGSYTYTAPTGTVDANPFNVQYTVRDAEGDTSTANLVININAAPVLGGGDQQSFSIAENTTAITTITSTDADGDARTYSIAGGADAAKFTIDPNTGVLKFITAPDYENPTDNGANNVYDVKVQVTDGQITDIQAITVTVTNANEAPVITSPNGGNAFAISIAENTTAVTDVDATDPDGTAITYTLSGADAAKFTVSAAGVVTFISAPNFEAPGDVGGDNVYNITVTASDGTLTDTQALAITVTNVANEGPPAITSNSGGASASVSIAENTTAVTTVTATDPDGAAITYSISGGADALKFTINPTTGVLTFIAAPNFEAPTDAGTNNVYDVVVQASDGTLTDTQAIAVTVTNVNEFDPVITSNSGGATASISVAENTKAVTTVTATDADAGSTITYSISGGADAAKFAINASTGALTFVNAPDFENPTDVGGNNVYDVVVTASDGTKTDTQTIAVTVTNVAENAAPVGVADNLFLNGPSGTVVTLQNAWLVKNDTDADGNTLNVATATDGTNVDAGAVTATTTTITYNGNSNSTGSFTYTATDGIAPSAATTVSVTRGNNNATITGGAGNDILIETRGDDGVTLNGGAGNDFIIGGSGTNTIVGEQNDYLLDGGGDVDTLNIGAAFNDVSNAQIVNIENIVLTAAVTLNLGDQTEGFTITGSAGIDSITGGGGADTIVGAQNDSLLDGGGGTDTLNLGANFTSSSDAHVANIENVTLTAAATLNLSNQSEGFNITGSSGDDIITGGGGIDVIHAGAGKDTVTGGGGADSLFGDAGNDTLVWDSADSFDGGADFDRVQLLTGNNTFTYDAVGAGVKFANIEMIDLGDGSDRGSSQNQVNINASDVLDLGNSGTLVSAGTAGNVRIDLFVIGDNSGNAAGKDNVDLTGFSIVDINGGTAGSGTFSHTDAVTGVSHTYNLYSDGGTKLIAIEENLDVS